MNVLDKIKAEPALLIGLLVSVFVLVQKLLVGDAINEGDLVAIVGPFLGGVATRSRVSPTAALPDDPDGLLVPLDE